MKKRRRNWQTVAWWVLSAFIVSSMLVSMVLMVRPAPPPKPTPTVPLATETAGPGGGPAPERSTEGTATPTPAPSAIAPAAGEDDEFTFAVCGDSRDGDAVFRQIVRQVSEERPAFLIHTGDLVSHGGEAEYEAFQGLLAGLAVPFYPVPGNHDASGGGLAAYLEYSGAPAAHYAFDYGQAHFAFVDSHGGSLSAEETAWLDSDLAATEQPLKIVVLHHPPFDPNGSTHIMQSGNEAFMQLVQSRGVRYVFAGHIHAFAEGERGGVRYVITGGAGAPLYETEARGGFFHYLRVTVRGAELEYETVRVEPALSLLGEAFASVG
jgi:predicted phosphodiesterase